MNRIYKSVWNEQTATFVAVAENTKARGKRSSGGACASQAVLEWVQGLRLRTVALALLSAGVLTQPAMAQITDGWELAVDGATPFHVIPGGAFSLTSGNNIALTQTGGTVAVALNPDLNVDSVTASGMADAAVNASSTEAVSGKVLYGVLNSGDGIKYFHGSSIKADSVASGADPTAIGPQATSSGEAALAAGLESEATDKEAIALGARSGTGNTVENGIAIGSDAGTTSKGSDLTRVASLRTEQGQHLVRFQLNSLGARKLAEVSSGNVGALLVLVMEDQVAQVARIGEPLKQGMIYLSMPDDAAAQRLLRQVQG